MAWLVSATRMLEAVRMFLIANLELAYLPCLVWCACVRFVSVMTRSPSAAGVKDRPICPTAGNFNEMSRARVGILRTAWTTVEAVKASSKARKRGRGLWTVSPPTSEHSTVQTRHNKNTPTALCDARVSCGHVSTGIECVADSPSSTSPKSKMSWCTIESDPGVGRF